MSKELNKLLDKCIDRMNEGESLEGCLASYPEHAEELEPLLRAMYNFRDTCSIMPRATAKSVVRRRLDAALVNSDRRLQEHQRRPTPFFGRPRALATVAIVLVLALIGFGLHWILTPGVAPVVAQANFRLLLSDEENAIGDFASLNVTITSIGMLRGGEGGGWEVIEIEPSVVVDLTRLQGLNAQEIWSGNLEPGEYIAVFIYIENAIGTLKSGETVNVIVPSGNLQISKPFTITAGDPVVNFVYDVTVVVAGNEYVLWPQVDQSGSHQSHHEVGEGELTLQVGEIDGGVFTAGHVAPGDEITVLVFQGNPDNPVEGATVTVNDVPVVDLITDLPTTNEYGLISFAVPPEVDELEIKAVYDGLEGELEIEWSELILEVVAGTVAPGQEITLRVTYYPGGNPAVDFPVWVNDVLLFDPTTGDQIKTDGDGEVTFDVPPDVDELEIKVELGDWEVEREWEFGDELILQVVAGTVAPSNEITIRVTYPGGNPAKGFPVWVNDMLLVDLTDGNGEVTFTVPAEVDKLEIKVRLGDWEVEREWEFGDELILQVVAGTVAPSNEITIRVTYPDGTTPAVGAEVWMNDMLLDDLTDGNGEVTFTVPADVDELELKVELGDWKVERSDWKFGSSSELTLQVIDADTLQAIDDDDVTPGDIVFVLVTFEEEPVKGATVTVEDVGDFTTGNDGLTTKSFTVPDEEELEIKAVIDGLKGKLEIELEED